MKLAPWQGPYRVLHRVGEVNYKIYMPDKRKRRVILHINMLKKLHQPEAMCLWTVGVDPDEENDVPTWRGEESGRSPSVGTQLTVQQKRQLLELLSDFKSVMSGRCGRTSITTGGLPVRQRMVIIKKKDDTIRLCIDYRRLNAETMMDAYPTCAKG